MKDARSVDEKPGTIYVLCLLYACHMVEEFTLGFVGWGDRYFGRFDWTQNLIGNAMFFVCLAFACHLYQKDPAKYLWVGMSGAMWVLANAFLHISATILGGEYSPGVVTATVLYVPGGLYFLVKWGRKGLLTWKKHGALFCRRGDGLYARPHVRKGHIVARRACQGFLSDQVRGGDCEGGGGARAGGGERGGRRARGVRIGSRMREKRGRRSGPLQKACDGRGRGARGRRVADWGPIAREAGPTERARPKKLATGGGRGAGGAGVADWVSMAREAGPTERPPPKRRAGCKPAPRAGPGDLPAFALIVGGRRRRHPVSQFTREKGTQMAEKLRAVLAGCGGMGGLWIDMVRSVPEVELVGFVDTDPEAAKRRAAESGAPDAAAGTDVGAVLDATRPDLVFDCTPPEAHLAVGAGGFRLRLPPAGRETDGRLDGQRAAAAGGLAPGGAHVRGDPEPPLRPAHPPGARAHRGWRPRPADDA